jgi:hypothetical protein
MILAERKHLKDGLHSASEGSDMAKEPVNQHLYILKKAATWPSSESRAALGCHSVADFLQYKKKNL